MGWQALNDDFYGEYGHYFVCAIWNGIKPDGSGRQEVSFLTDQTPPLRDYALSTLWPDCARFFHEEHQARAYLEAQDTLRPHPLSREWQVLRLSEMEERFGYRPNTKLAILGNQSLGHPPSPDVPAAVENSPAP